MFSIAADLYLKRDSLSRKHNQLQCIHPSHLQLLTILSSQMVISLENAEFYGKLEEKVSQRTQELNSKNVELADSNSQLQTAFKHIQKCMTE